MDKINFENLPSTNTPVNAENLNLLQTNVDNAKIEKTIVSDLYDPTKNYTAGEYCIYENTLYRCTGATTGAWDETKWIVTSIVSELEYKLNSKYVTHNQTVLYDYIGYKRTNNLSNTWYKLGTISGFNLQGACCFIKCLCGAGQNGQANQNLIIDIMIKRGWTGQGVSRIAAATYTIFKMANAENLSNYKVKLIATDENTFDIWMFGAGAYSCFDYNVAGHFNKFEPSDSYQDNEPNYGYSQEVQGGYIAWSGTL